MTDRKTLEALLERVQGAGGKDRELDARLWYNLESPSRGQPLANRLSEDEFARQANNLVPVTSSIDEALALVERVLPGAIISLTGPFYDVVVWTPETRGEAKNYESAPLAILDALLRALIARRESSAA